MVVVDKDDARPATLEEITNIIKELKNRKAPGKDNISNMALKNLPQNAKIRLQSIINAVIKETLSSKMERSISNHA